MSIKWTDEQLEAINAETNSGAILVSAAAGSGKTAVLVERIVNKIMSGGMSIDRMLVVTFTEAAASEMRDKIIARMYSALSAASKEDAEFIKRQIRLSASADIMTIDAFCIRVLRNNFYLMGIDPDFRIADGAEAGLIADDAMDALFSRLYCAEEDSEESISFNHLLNIYAGNRDDIALQQLVKDIYGFTQSFAEPEKWLDEKAEMYSENIEESMWVKECVTEFFIRDIGRRYYAAFEKLISGMAEGIGYSGETDESLRAELSDAYGEMANGMINLRSAAKAVMEASSWKEACAVYDEYIENMEIDSLTLRNKPKGISAELEDWKYYCKARNDLKASFFRECEVFKHKDISKLLHGDSLKRLCSELVWLVKEFGREYEYRKDLRNAREFSDIEHMVYRLFNEIPEIRAQYRSRYDEILIDEYQDTNGLQDSIFSLISNSGKNMFMVGDLKQSIYRFRGGDPTIFKGKAKSYAMTDNADTRIDLSQNFRSRQEILHSVNNVFESIMTEELGDVNYSGREKIVRHSDSGDRLDEYKSEAHFVVYNKDGDEEFTAAEAEAEFIADKVRNLIDSGFMIDGKDGKQPVKSRDICILSRSVRGGIGEIISAALLKRGINSYVEIEDYFEKREIRLMMSLISVIDNNLQDIPLVAVMRSPIGGFTDNDIAKIRIYSPVGSVYSAVKNYRADEDGITDREIAIKIKCRKLIKNLEKWRGYVKRKSVANLIWSIYEETGLYDFMGAMEGGEESQANLRLLYERAKQYEQSGFKGLFNFIKYMEKLESRKNNLSSANLTGEGHDVVRIMTIHKSKGLEFPVVILFGMGKRLRKNTKKESVMLHKDFGFGLKYADADMGYFEDTLFSEIVRRQNRREEMAEDMRVLYVAMTRPKNKLIAVASKKLSDSASKTHMEAAEQQAAKWENGINPAEASSYADWIYPAAIAYGENWEFRIHDYVRAEEEKEKTEAAQMNLVSDELREVVKKSFEYEYEFLKSGYIPAKTSVTALKQKSNEEELDVENADRKYEYDPIYMEDMPEFMREKKRGSEVGTAHHQVMAYVDIKRLHAAEESMYEELIEMEMLRIASEGQLDSYYCEDSAMKKSIVQHVAGFFRSPLGKRVMAAEHVYREQPFQIEIGANVYDPSLEARYSNEKVILQGVIDCFFENEDGSVVLLDYKTDRCTDETGIKRIADKYSVQLRLYADAIERITGRKTNEKYLYLFAVGKEIMIK